jgi:hypothetical protein
VHNLIGNWQVKLPLPRVKQEEATRKQNIEADAHKDEGSSFLLLPPVLPVLLVPHN